MDGHMYDSDTEGHTNNQREMMIQRYYLVAAYEKITTDSF